MNIKIGNEGVQFFYGFVDLTPEQIDYVEKELIDKLPNGLLEAYVWGADEKFNGETVSLNGCWFDSSDDLNENITKEVQDLFYDCFNDMCEDPESDTALSPFLNTHIGAYVFRSEEF